MKKEYVIGYLDGVKVEIQWFEGKYWYWNDRSVKWVPAPPNLITQPENTPTPETPKTDENKKYLDNAINHARRWN